MQVLLLVPTPCMCFVGVCACVHCKCVCVCVYVCLCKCIATVVQFLEFCLVSVLLQFQLYPTSLFKIIWTKKVLSASLNLVIQIHKDFMELRYQSLSNINGSTNGLSRLSFLQILVNTGS